MIIGFSLSMVWVVPYSGNRTHTVAVQKARPVGSVAAAQLSRELVETADDPAVYARLADEEDGIDSLLSEEDKYRVSDTAAPVEKKEGGLVHLVWQQLFAKATVNGDRDQQKL